MKNTSISLFRQILDLVPKHEFEKIIMKHNGDKRKQFESSFSFDRTGFAAMGGKNNCRRAEPDQ